METVTEILKIFANSALQVGVITAIIGGGCSIWMLTQSTKRTKQSKATKLDALFLASSSPGFSRFSLLNSPDTIGIGVFTALALEQVGALNDIRPQIEVNLKLYPSWPVTYLSAARYSALTGDKKKANDYFSVAKTLINEQNVINDMPQLNATMIEELIISEPEPIQSSESIDSMFTEIRKKPLQLILARSVPMSLGGLGLIFVGAILHIIKTFIA